MKVAFFDPVSGAAVRLFSGQPADAEAAMADPRWASAAARVLDDTLAEGVASRASLATLAEFDAGKFLKDPP